MSKPTRIETLSATLAANVSVNDQNQVVLKDGGKIWADNLPEGVTSDIVKSLSAYRQDFTVAYGDVIGAAIVQHAKAHDDVANLEHLLETDDVDFGAGFARPVVKKGQKLTPELVEAGITIYNRVKCNESVAGVAKKLAGLWE